MRIGWVIIKESWDRGRPILCDRGRQKSLERIGRPAFFAMIFLLIDVLPLSKLNF